MKKFLLFLVITMAFIIPLKVFAINTFEAKEKIDVTKESSVTLNYNYEDYNFNNTFVKVYYVAMVTSDFQYELSTEFNNFPIEINGIQSEDEWTILEQTLNAYIEAAKIKETYLLSIKNNKIELPDLKAGLYFIKTDEIKKNEYELVFDDMMLNIPFLNDNGTWNYDVSVNVKAEVYTPKYENVTYNVIKEWKDDNKNRPEEVDIEIYKDGNLVETRSLSQDTNWTYSWNTLDDGSNWTVVEKDINKDYSVSIWEKDNNFIIINTKKEYINDNPKTEDNIYLYFGLLSISLVGFLSIILGLFMKRKN